MSLVRGYQQMRVMLLIIALKEAVQYPFCIFSVGRKANFSLAYQILFLGQKLKSIGHGYFNCEKYIGNKSFVYFYLPNSFRIPQNKSYLKQMSECKISENRDFILFECPPPYISSSNRCCQVFALFSVLYTLASKFLKQLHEVDTVIPIQR